MIYLFTGQPGHGKTALALARAFELKKKGRTIYAHGVKDLDFDKAGFKRFPLTPSSDPNIAPREDASRWQELIAERPVFLIDECYTDYPNRNPGAKVPPHIQALATHRHHGVDFIFVCQQSVQVDPFIRGLIEQHVHVRKSWMPGKINLRTWDQFQSNTKAHCSDVKTWIKPKFVHDYYTSTVLDTTERNFPKWLKVTLALLACAIAVVAFAKHRLDKKIDEGRAATQQAAGTDPSGALGRGAAAKPTTIAYADAQEYSDAIKPRVPEAFWTAPAFDGRPVVSEPRALCTYAAAGLDANGQHLPESCHCKTEQGTAYALEFRRCKLLAFNGEPYNPFKRSEPEPQSMPQAQPVAAEAPHAGSVGIGSPRQVQASYGGFRQQVAP